MYEANSNLKHGLVGEVVRGDAQTNENVLFEQRAIYENNNKTVTCTCYVQTLI